MSAPTLTPADIKEMLLKVADVIIESEEILSQADRDLGDGDHGLGMQRGFSAAKAQLEALDPKTVAEVFTTTGMALMASMGGASGAVMGMLFQSGGAALGANESLDADGLCAFLRGACDGVTNLGGAKPGDKTMVDALAAARDKTEDTECQSIAEACHAAAAGANEGMEATKAMIATVGRAKTLGEKSIGFPDPGALSVSIILQTMSDFANQ
ncbi:MAG: dihydroxyacetone kinase subunit DhaL [Verrucomicrobiota bacterium]|nr:dihydroxyacetone kinase subunit DhaL [Verrucomicrobiota bacterium]